MGDFLCYFDNFTFEVKSAVATFGLKAAVLTFWVRAAVETFGKSSGYFLIQQLVTLLIK